MPAPQAVLFDAYGTLFDVCSVAQLAEQLFPGHGTAISVLWRDKQIEYTRLVTTSNHGAHYRPFSELTRAALAYAIKIIATRACNTGVSGTFDTYFDAKTDVKNDFKSNPSINPSFNPQVNTKIDQLVAQYNQLTAFPENREVLATLKSRGITTGILSNGDPGMLNAVVAASGLGDLLDHVISVHPVRKFKTHPEAYALGEAACGLPARKIAFVSSNSWDALAATWYGYQTLWVNRQNMPFEELGTSPHKTGTSLRDVLTFF
jgi:2-haloacid dehalogenase